MGLDAELEQVRVSVKRLAEGRKAKLGKLRVTEYGLVHKPPFAPLANQFHGITERDYREHFHGLGQKRTRDG